MDDNKRFGVITMVVAIVLIFAFLAISDGWYAYADFGFVQLLMTILQVRMFQGDAPSNILGMEGEYFIDIPTKYLILLCLSALGAGLLLYKGVLQLPFKKIQSAEKNHE